MEVLEELPEEFLVELLRISSTTFEIIASTNREGIFIKVLEKFALKLPER